MHCFANKPGTLTTAVLAAIAMAAIVLTQIRAQEPAAKPEAEPSKLAADLVGTWELAETPGQAGVPAGSLKFFTGKHWTVTNFDEGGNVQYHHGGTYALDGDENSETIKYATERTASMIGQTLKFKIKVEGDKYTQEGIGNPYNEVWTRAK